MELKRIDRIVITGIALFLIIWAVSRCSRRDGNKVARSANRDTTAVVQNRPAAQQPMAQTPQPAAPAQPATVYVQKVYAALDSLKVRLEPKLNANVVTVARKGDELTFSGETTTFKQIVKLNGNTYNEPWLKIKTPSGTTGWVYGGGVKAYKSN